MSVDGRAIRKVSGCFSFIGLQIKPKAARKVVPLLGLHTP